MKTTISAQKYFSIPIQDVQGSSDNEITHIYQRLDNFLMVRKTHIKALKPGEPIDICQISDIHFNYLIAADFEEQNPAVMSSRPNRVWLKGGESIKNAMMAMEYGSHCDQTVITGDILDYFTKGALECTKKYIWDSYPDTICSLGGHDVTCNMQGTVPDTTPLEEKYKALQSIWNHELLYYSRIISDRVMVIQMNNDLESYTDEQYQKLSADIEKARREQLVVLIFQHETLSTGNPEDINVKSIRPYDKSDTADYYNIGAGRQGSSKNTMNVYNLITSSADVIKGIFCGHRHNDVYMEIKAHYTDNDGKIIDTTIPQYILTANAYDAGNVRHIVIE